MDTIRNNLVQLGLKLKLQIEWKISEDQLVQLYKRYIALYWIK